ncbi:MAG: hypothetical protein M1834_007341 [Cirrosporium novae-zelandiae]|nr:MAG: hypothetical protein M1834_007341 [Cirrosporium novae-zelandiae]
MSITEFISLQTPPGPIVLSYTTPPNNPTNAPIPKIFIESMAIRHEVFVKQQNVPWELELDLLDPHSYTWVAYASVAQNATEDRQASVGERTPVGTIRLVPPGHDTDPLDDKVSVVDGNEVFVKLGRLAVLNPFRGLGLARLLVNTALEYAIQHPEEIVLPYIPPRASESEISGGAAVITSSIEINVKSAKSAIGPWKGLVVIHAQVNAVGIWEKMGFVKDEGMGTWDEAGIEHVGMWRRVTPMKN